MSRVARWLGCTEGRAYSLTIGVLVALVTAAIGVPPTLAPQPTGAQRTSELADASADERGEPTAVAPEPGDDPFGEGTAANLPDPVVGQPPSAPSSSSTTSPPPKAPERSSEPSGAGAPPPPTFSDTDATGSAAAFGDASVFAEVGDPGAPHGVAVDSRGRVHVVTDNAPGRGGGGPSVVVRYDATGAEEAALEIDGQAEGRRTGLLGLAIDSDDRVYVLNSDPAQVVSVDLDDGSQEVVAELPDLEACLPPLRTEDCAPGTTDSAPLPTAAAFDPAGNLFVTDAGQATVWRLAGGSGAPEQWHSDSAYAAGPPEGGLAALSFDREGDLLLLVTTSFHDVALAQGFVHRVAVASDGSAGARIEIARTGSGDAPTGLAVGASSQIYVALSGADELLVLSESGEETQRLDSKTIEESAGVPLDTPAGLGFLGDALLVTNKSAVLNDPAHWVVFEVAVLDERVEPRGLEAV